jgi:hypothetical protein
MPRPAATLAAALLLAASAPAAADPATEVTQYGITWTFDEPREVGQFVTGDWWVVGPVTVTSVSPAPTGTRNGSEVNPTGGGQGYDDRGGEFDADRAVTFPLTLEVDHSLVSSASKPDGAETHNVGCLQSQAVLTAVAAPLPPTALRPAYAGTYKRHFDSAGFHWEVLPDLEPPPSAPDPAWLLRAADRPRIDHIGAWTIQHSCAEDNWYNGDDQHPCYGREVSAFVSEAAQFVMLDTPERDELALSLVQLGIDNYGVVRAGGSWPPDGGHHSGRKWPVVFAAHLLNDCDMLAVGADHGDPGTGGRDATFGEDGHTYFGAEGTALFGWDCGDGFGTFFEDGCTGAGAQDCRDPDGLVDGCESYRNCCTSAYWVGQALAALMLDARDTWSHPAYFDYVDRWMSADVDGGGSAASALIDAMWELHRDALPTPAALPACDASGDGDGGPGGADASPDAAAGSGDGGCGCRTSSSGGGILAVAFLALALVRASGGRSRRRPARPRRRT